MLPAAMAAAKGNREIRYALAYGLAVAGAAISCASFSASAGVIVKPGAMERAGSVERNHLAHVA